MENFQKPLSNRLSSERIGWGFEFFSFVEGLYLLGLK